MKRIEDWDSRLLSGAGRLYLVKFFLQSLILHWLQVLPIPINIASKVDRILRNFLWTGSHLTKPFCLVKWEMICQTFSTGEHGIWSLHDMNIACLMKWTCKLLSSHNSLWAIWCKENYLEAMTTAATNRRSLISTSGNTLWAWKNWWPS